MNRYPVILLLWFCCAGAAASSISGHIAVQFGAAEPLQLAVDRLSMAQNYPRALTTLPDLQLELRSAGPVLIPDNRLPLASGHPLWQFIAGEGDWSRSDDNTLELRLPLTLIERDANCLHYGILRVSLPARASSGVAEFDITSQTCEYLKFTARYRGTVAWQPSARPRLEAHQAAFPVSGLEQLRQDHGIDATALAPPQGVSTEHLTLAGLLLGDRHYQSACGTVHEPYPWCERLPLPTFSLSKSLFAGVAMMRLEQLAPGSADRSIGELLPDCGDSWKDVSIRQAVNMQTGHYADPGYFNDEDSAIESPLFLAPGHVEKLAYACSAYPPQEPAGGRWVYHTSDTYIAVSAMSALLRELRPTANADIYRDLLYHELWTDLKVSPLLAFTRRTDDIWAQPYGGWGQVVTADDLLQLARWLQREARAPHSLAPSLLQPTISPAGRRPGVNAGTSGLRYLNGFWLLDAGSALGCRAPYWIPFLSGHGGITLALLSDQAIYYYVSDNNEYKWLSAVIAVHQQTPLCS
ncbi:hypothetical protein CWI75_00495 [Kineobactrum sediminis]|uniref:Beta-lactamase-related domain-containing protein n=1 Tax=Kineobactrum sediminis TaxID=1905677 RepID=A0A2N5Y651_9GAMM|nr:serine hydrolase domain-containing protein [Kineobactrum sediminis]PLW83875.1 hypothetical protein CWI75_00495 [Kineobactrum sediminis]